MKILQNIWKHQLDNHCFSLRKVHGHRNKIETPHQFSHISAWRNPPSRTRCVVCVNLSALKTCKKTGPKRLFRGKTGDVFTTQLCGEYNKLTNQYTLPETNSEFTPENGWLADDSFPCGDFAYFQGQTTSSRKGTRWAPSRSL